MRLAQVSRSGGLRRDFWHGSGLMLCRRCGDGPRGAGGLGRVGVLCQSCPIIGQACRVGQGSRISIPKGLMGNSIEVPRGNPRGLDTTMEVKKMHVLRKAI